MTRPGIEPRFPGPLANTLSTRLTDKRRNLLFTVFSGRTKKDAEEQEEQITYYVYSCTASKKPKWYGKL